ncbi:hypothetical protein AA313_de0204963 [Arthrobotrys entomopaga]|nr:hypothetical protein AA313_de0204963 [Arthrobotrys entomopaga]
MALLFRRVEARTRDAKNASAEMMNRSLKTLFSLPSDGTKSFINASLQPIPFNRSLIPLSRSVSVVVVASTKHSYSDNIPSTTRSDRSSPTVITSPLVVLPVTITLTHLSKRFKYPFIPFATNPFESSCCRYFRANLPVSLSNSSQSTNFSTATPPTTAQSTLNVTSRCPSTISLARTLPPSGKTPFFTSTLITRSTFPTFSFLLFGAKDIPSTLVSSSSTSDMPNKCITFINLTPSRKSTLKFATRHSYSSSTFCTTVVKYLQPLRHLEGLPKLGNKVLQTRLTTSSELFTVEFFRKSNPCCPSKIPRPLA